MRRHGHPRVTPERVALGQGLLPVGVERRVREPARVERGQQRVLHHQRAAAGVQEHRALGHPAQAPCVHQVGGGARVRHEQHRDRRPAQRLPQPPLAGERAHAVDPLRGPRPAGDREAQARQRGGAGRAQRAEPQHRHGPVAGERRRRGIPAVLGVGDMRVEAEVVAQDVARDPFHHALRQPRIDHPGERRPERPVPLHVLHPRPEVQHALQPGVGPEVLQRGARRVDDPVHRGRVGRVGERADLGPHARLAQRARQVRLVAPPALGGGGEEDEGHGAPLPRGGRRFQRRGLPGGIGG